MDIKTDLTGVRDKGNLEKELGKPYADQIPSNVCNGDNVFFNRNIRIKLSTRYESERYIVRHKIGNQVL